MCLQVKQGVLLQLPLAFFIELEKGPPSGCGFVFSVGPVSGVSSLHTHGAKTKHLLKHLRCFGVGGVDSRVTRNVGFGLSSSCEKLGFDKFVIQMCASARQRTPSQKLFHAERRHWAQGAQC